MKFIIRHGNEPTERRDNHGAIAVSYTHLDVYKRQMMYSAVKASAIWVEVAADAAVECEADIEVFQTARAPG